MNVLAKVKLGAFIRIYFGRSFVQGKFQGKTEDAAVIVTNHGFIFYIRLSEITAVRL